MPRKPAEPDLKMKTPRKKVPTGKRIFEHLTAKNADLPTALVYRRGKNGIGTWSVRWRNPNTGDYQLDRLAEADDVREADGVEVMTWQQARTAAEQLARRLAALPSRTSAVDTVQAAVEAYIAHQRKAKGERAALSAEQTARTHIYGSRLAGIKLSKLRTADIATWRDAIVTAPPRVRAKGGAVKHRDVVAGPEYERKRKATANRVLTVLKAALNRALMDGHIAADVWKLVKPFAAVDAARIDYLSDDECTRLINACQPDLRLLVQAALHTGARYRELTNLTVSDFDADAGTLMLRETKNGLPRRAYFGFIDGREFFEQQTAGRARDEFIFLRSNGKPWQKSEQSEPMKLAVKAARIGRNVGFHTLRHTVGSRLARENKSPQFIATVLGHRDTRITMKHYAHLSEDHITEGLRAMGATLGGTTEKKVTELKPKRRKS